MIQLLFVCFRCTDYEYLQVWGLLFHIFRPMLHKGVAKAGDLLQDKHLMFTMPSGQPLKALPEKSGHYVPMRDPKLHTTCPSPAVWHNHKNLCICKKLSYRAQLLSGSQTASRVLVQELISPSYGWWFKSYKRGIQAQAFKTSVHTKCLFSGRLWLTRHLYNLLTILTCTHICVLQWKQLIYPGW